MKAYSAIAATLAACVMGIFYAGPASSCTEDRCGGTAATSGTLLQLSAQKTSARATHRSSGKNKYKHVRSKKKAPIAQEGRAQEETTETTAAEESDAPLPVVVVRTTREANDDGPAVVSENEFNDLDRIASAPSMMISTIFNYLGGPAVIAESDSQDLNSDAAAETAEARASFASAANQSPPSPPNVALEYILMTFGGALAAAAAIRLFVV